MLTKTLHTMFLLAVLGAGSQALADTNCPVGAVMAEGGNSKVQVGDRSGTLPGYGLHLAIGGSCDTYRSVQTQIGLALAYDQFQGKVGGQNTTLANYGAGPRICFIFATETSVCVNAKVVKMSLKQSNSYELGATPLGLEVDQNIYRDLALSLSAEQSVSMTGGANSQLVNAQSLLFGIGWAP